MAALRFSAGKLLVHPPSPMTLAAPRQKNASDQPKVAALTIVTDPVNVVPGDKNTDVCANPVTASNGTSTINSRTRFTYAPPATIRVLTVAPPVTAVDTRVRTAL